MKARAKGTYPLIDNWVLGALPTLANAADIKILMQLAARAWDTHKTQTIGTGELHDLTGMDIRTIQRSLLGLLESGYIVGANGEHVLCGGSSYANYAVVSRHIPIEIRREVFERDGYICSYCGSEEDLILEHLQPWSRGGLHALENLVVACRSCNSSKNAKTPNEWAAHQGVN